MRTPHLPLYAEASAPDEVRALFPRAHEKLGPVGLPAALRRLGASPVLFRDAMLNLALVFGEAPPLPRVDRLLLGLAVAVALGDDDLAGWLDALAGAEPPAVRRGVIEVAIACRTLNGYYRALALAEGGWEAERQARLRASPLAHPPVPRPLAELVCVAVSAAMSCRGCVVAHARAAREVGVAPAQLDEALRIQAVLVGLAGADPGGVTEPP